MNGQEQLFAYASDEQVDQATTQTHANLDEIFEITKHQTDDRAAIVSNWKAKTREVNAQAFTAQSANLLVNATITVEAFQAQLEKLATVVVRLTAFNLHIWRYQENLPNVLIDLLQVMYDSARYELAHREYICEILPEQKTQTGAPKIRIYKTTPTAALASIGETDF